MPKRGHTGPEKVASLTQGMKRLRVDGSKDGIVQTPKKRGPSATERLSLVILEQNLKQLNVDGSKDEVSCAKVDVFEEILEECGAPRQRRSEFEEPLESCGVPRQRRKESAVVEDVDSQERERFLVHVESCMGPRSRRVGLPPQPTKADDMSFKLQFDEPQQSEPTELGSSKASDSVKPTYRGNIEADRCVITISGRYEGAFLLLYGLSFNEYRTNVWYQLIRDSLDHRYQIMAHSLETRIHLQDLDNAELTVQAVDELIAAVKEGVIPDKTVTDNIAIMAEAIRWVDPSCDVPRVVESLENLHIDKTA
ncbi:hypothetical protein LTR09_003331 [Extremus antarcticus]|uniref:Uncharacterized protein n=1 Tax=Extremus antarcticus TaxID=702011 RepID=A0AAJ0GER0_9PEZI|nr:hypothetical protein LTR09_003331 [Extremus antarcticus]